jgi:hypothetical protein
MFGRNRRSFSWFELASSFLSHQLAQLDVHKQAGQWARLYKRIQAAEARLRQAEQETPPSQAMPLEYAKRAEEQANERGPALSPAEVSPAGGRDNQLYALASDLPSWKGGLKVLRRPSFPNGGALSSGRSRPRSRRCSKSMPGCAQTVPNRVVKRCGQELKNTASAVEWLLSPSDAVSGCLGLAIFLRGPAFHHYDEEATSAAFLARNYQERG